MWAINIVLDQPSLDRLDWFAKNSEASKSATIRLAIEERYNRLHKDAAGEISNQSRRSVLSRFGLGR
jgi:hypothetical protein